MVDGLRSAVTTAAVPGVGGETPEGAMEDVEPTRTETEEEGSKIVVAGAIGAEVTTVKEGMILVGVTTVKQKEGMRLAGVTTVKQKEEVGLAGVKEAEEMEDVGVASGPE